MYELIKITDRDYYIECPARIGIVKLNDTDVCIIDSGNDDGMGKKILKILNANGWTLKAIYNTHSHADHIGGNAYLQAQTGCKVYAYGAEQGITCNTILEPTLLYGAFPFVGLKGRFLYAKESDALPMTPESLPEGMEMIKLGGHALGMVGFRTQDDTVFLADCLSSREIIDKYKICFLYDVAEYLKTLEAVKEMNARIFVPSHVLPSETIAELAQYNIDATNQIADTIQKFCSEPITFDKLMQKLFTHYGLLMNAQQYMLIGSTVRSYLAYLSDSGRIKYYFENNLMLWTNNNTI